MRIGVSVERFDWPGGAAAIGPTLARIGRCADDSGVDTLWLTDHFFQIPLFGSWGDPMPEAYTGLAFVAAATTRVGLGTLTTGATYRHPGVLLKIVSTLDVLSGGRAWLGIGPPWHEREMRALGIPVPSWDERFERLEETLRLARQVFDGVPGQFAGRHHQLAEPVLTPPPLSRPPILVGGAHERRVLRLAAEHADACNLFETGGTRLLRMKLDVLRRHCDEVGRDYGDVLKTTYGPIALSRRRGDGTATVGEAVRRLAELADLGVSLAILSPADPTDPAGWALLAELVGAARDL